MTSRKNIALQNTGHTFYWSLELNPSCGDFLIFYQRFLLFLCQHYRPISPSAICIPPSQDIRLILTHTTGFFNVYCCHTSLPGNAAIVTAHTHTHTHAMCKYLTTCMFVVLWYHPDCVSTTPV
jgi:hypothetical protein